MADGSIIIGKLDDKALRDSIDSLVNYVEQSTSTIKNSFKNSLADVENLFTRMSNASSQATQANTQNVSRRINDTQREKQANEDLVSSYDSVARALNTANNQNTQSTGDFISRMRELNNIINSWSSFPHTGAFGVIELRNARQEIETNADRIKEEIRRIKNEIDDWKSRPMQGGFIGTIETNRLRAELAELESALGKINQQEQAVTQTSSQYTEEIRKQAQLIREKAEAQGKDLYTFQSQYNNTFYTVDTKSKIISVEEQLLEIKRQEDELAKSNWATNEQITQQTKQQLENKRSEKEIIERGLEAQQKWMNGEINTKDFFATREALNDMNNAWNVLKQHAGKDNPLVKSLHDTAVEAQKSKNALVETGKASLATKNEYSALENVIAKKLHIMQSDVQLNRADESSIRALQATLKQLTETYNRLDAKERNSAIGRELVINIQEAKRSISELQQAMSKPVDLKAALGMSDNTLNDITHKIQALTAYRNGLNITSPKDKEELKQVNAELDRLSKRQTEIMGKNKSLMDSNNALTRSWNYMKNRLAFMLTVGGTANFIKSLIQVRAEYEALERSLGILFQSAERGTQIFNELNAMAIKSPFTLLDLGGAARQLAAFGFEASEVVNVTKRLGDMAAAVGAPIDRLTYALGQVQTYGYLTSIQSRAFIRAGIPLVKQLAESYSNLEGRVVTTTEVYQRMKDKAVSFNDVMNVIYKQTDAGGRFFDYQAKMAGTLKVEVANLSLAYNNMLNEMGKSGQSMIITPIHLLKQLMLNWKGIINTLASVGIAYAAVKVAQMSSFMATTKLNRAVSTQVLTNKKARLSALLLKAENQKLTIEKRKQILAEAEMIMKNKEGTSAELARAMSQKQLSMSQTRLLLLNNQSSFAYKKAILSLGLMTKEEMKAALATNGLTTALGGLGRALAANWVFLLITALMELYFWFSSNKEAANQLNEEIRNGAKEGADVYKNYLSQLRDSGVYKTETLKDNSIKIKVELTKEEAEKAWNEFEHQIIETTKGGRIFIKELLGIDNVNKRLEKGVGLLMDMEDVMRKMSTIDGLGVTQNTILGGLFGEGFSDDLEDYEDKLEHIKQTYKDLSNVPVFETAGLKDEFNEVVQEAAKSAEKIYKAFKDANIDISNTSSEQMFEAFQTVIEHISQQEGWTQQQRYDAFVILEKAMTKKFKAEWDERIKHSIGSTKEGLIQQRDDFMAFWEQQPAVQQIFLDIMDGNFRSEIDNLKAHQDDLNYYTYGEGLKTWTRWLGVIRSKSEQAYLVLKNWASNVSLLKPIIEILIKTNVSGEDKDIIDTINNRNARLHSVNEDIALLTKAKERVSNKAELKIIEARLQAKEKEREELKKQDAWDEQKEKHDAQEARKRANRARTEANRQRADERRRQAARERAQRQAESAQRKREQELRQGLQDEISMIKDLQKSYENLTKSGIDGEKALELVQDRYLETFKNLNTTLKSYGLTVYNDENPITEGLVAGTEDEKHTFLGLLKQQLEQVKKSSAKTTDAIKVLERAIGELEEEVNTQTIGDIIDNLEKDVSDINLGYELSIEFDGEPELKNLYEDIIGGIDDILKDAPKTFSEYVDKINDEIVGSLHAYVDDFYTGEVDYSKEQQAVFEKITNEINKDFKKELEVWKAGLGHDFDIIKDWSEFVRVIDDAKAEARELAEDPEAELEYIDKLYKIMENGHNEIMKLRGKASQEIFDKLGLGEENFNILDINQFKRVVSALSQLGDKDNALVKIITKQRDELLKKQRQYFKNLDKLMDDYLAKYGKFSDKVRTIQAKRLRDIAQLDDSFGGKPEDREKNPLYIRAKNAIDRMANAEIQKLKLEAFKDSELYLRMFEKVGDVADATLTLLLSKVRQLREESKDLPISELKKLAEYEDKINKELNRREIARNPFKALVKYLKEYLPLSKKRTTIEKQSLDVEGKLESTRTQLTEETDKLEHLRQSGTQEQINAQEKIVEKYQEEVDFLQQQADQYQEDLKWLDKLVELINSSADEILKWGDSLKTSFNLLSEITQTLGAGGDFQDVMSDISVVIEGVVDMANGIKDFAKAYKEGDLLGKINGIIKVAQGLWKTVSTWFDNSNKKIDRSIQQITFAVSRLDNAYKNLENTLNETYGTQTIGIQKVMIANKELQLQELKRQLQLEESRKSKDRDESKIISLQGQINDLEIEIQNATKAIVTDLLGISSARDAAENLVSSMIDAFKQGEDYMAKFDESFEEMVDHMIMKAIVGRLIGDRINKILDYIQQKIDDRAGSADERLMLAKKNEQALREAENGSLYLGTGAKNYNELTKFYSSLGYNGEELIDRWKKDAEEYGLTDKEQYWAFLGANADFNKWLLEKYSQKVQNDIDEAQREIDAASVWTPQDVKDVQTMVGDFRGSVKEEFEAWMSAFGIKFGQSADKELSALQQGIQGITEDTAGAIESYLNSVSQQVYLQSDLLTQIRDVLTMYDFELQNATNAQILLSLQQSYQVQMAIQMMLSGWSSPDGLSVRVAMI
jgi:hypothetical protein